MQKIQILLVEDYELLRSAIRVALEKEDYEVWPAGDFEEFEGVLEEVTPALAILDFRFPMVLGRGPKELGFEAQEKLREAGVPVLGMSFDERPEGFGDWFIQKGFKLRKLLTVVREILGKEMAR